MNYSVFAVGIVCLGLSACASLNAGNPDGAAYAGSPQSVYDTAANPPRTNGTVTYNPNAPLPPLLPPAMGTSGAAMTAPPSSALKFSSHFFQGGGLLCACRMGAGLTSLCSGVALRF